jgi:dTDP-glucose 4,6-dehydratase
MKRALITGGAGFIAHHLISQILKNTDWEVVTLDRLDFSGNLNRLQDVLQEFSPEDRSRVRVVFHDLKAAVNPLIAADIGRVDYILHLAAGSHVDRSIDYPMEFVMDNVVELATSLTMLVVLTTLRGLYTSALMKYLVLLLMESTMVSMIGTILPTHIVQLRQVEKNWQ